MRVEPGVPIHPSLWCLARYTAREGPGSAAYPLLHLQYAAPSWKLTSCLQKSLSKGDDPVYRNSVYCRVSLLMIKVCSYSPVVGRVSPELIFSILFLNTVSIALGCSF